MSEVKLKVCESEKDDIGKGIVRLSEQTLQKLGINTENIIEITSKKTTSALALIYRSKITNQEVINLDGYIRKNAVLT